MTDESATIGAFPHRMRDLVRLSGVGAPTIHFYTQLGLLPPASKTAENQARYPAATVTRIGWIRRLQTELRLPLRSIGWILERHGELAVADIAALQNVGRLLDAPDPTAAAEELARVRERLDAADIADLANAGLVEIGATVSTADLQLLDVVADLRDAGFTREAGFDVAGLAVYRDAVETLVTAELRQFVEPMLAREDDAAISDLVRRGMPLANQLLCLLHQRAVGAEIKRWLDADGATAEQTA